MKKYQIKTKNRYIQMESRLKLCKCLLEKFKAKIMFYHLFLSNNEKKVLVLTLLKDLFKPIFPLWKYFLDKWKNSLKQVMKLKILGIYYFCDDKTLPALLEMYSKRERLNSKIFYLKKEM